MSGENLEPSVWVELTTVNKCKTCECMKQRFNPVQPILNDNNASVKIHKCAFKGNFLRFDSGIKGTR
jgi:hypothetical protein